MTSNPRRLSASESQRSRPVVRATVEQMTPILRRGAFQHLWRALLSIPTDILGSDSGLDALWCGLAARHYPRWPACVLLSTQSVVHTNTHTIHRFDQQERAHYFGPLNLYSYLMKHHARDLCGAARLPDAVCRPNGTMVIPRWTPRTFDDWHSRGSKMNPNGTSATRGCWGL